MADFFKKGIADRPPNLQRAKNQRRFWLKKGMDAKKPATVVFAHRGDFISFWEHTIEVEKGVFANFTCLQKNKIEKACPLCSYGDTPYYVGAATIIDRTPYKDAKGQDQQDTKKQLMAKSTTLDLIAIQMELHKKKTLGDLYGCEFAVLRSASDTSANVGDSWTFLNKYSEKEMVDVFGEEKVQTLDYNTIFAPYSIEDLAKIVAILPSAEAYFASKKFGPKSKGGSKGGASREEATASKKTPGDSDIPF